MTMRRPTYRRGWSSDFGREPLGVYEEKERERALDLVKGASRQKYGTELPPLPRVRVSDGLTDGGQAFEGRAVTAAANMEPPPIPQKGGGGVLGKLKRAGGVAMDVIDAPMKYAGKPAFGALTGLTEAERKPILDEQGRETGRYYRETASLLDAAKGIGKALTRDPRDTYREGKQAAEEYFADPNKNVVHRLGGDIATDPLNVIGIGMGKSAIVRGTKMAAEGGRGAKIAGSILKGVGRADEAFNTLQGKVAREAVGGMVGYTGSALAGGDTEQNLKMAGIGVLTGNLTRGGRSLPIRGADAVSRAAGRVDPNVRGAVPGGAMIKAGPELDDAVEAARTRRRAAAGGAQAELASSTPASPDEARLERRRNAARGPEQEPIAAEAPAPTIDAVLEGNGPAVAEPPLPDEGRVTRRRAAAKGAARAEEPPVSPPGDAPPPTEPPAPGMGEAPRGPDPAGPREDLLRGRTRDELITAKQAQLAGRNEGVRGRVLGKKRAETEIVRDELRRTNHFINEGVDAFVERLQSQADQVGLRVEPEGNQFVLRGPNGEAAMLSDVVEGATPEARAILESLSPEQRAIFEAAQQMRARVNATAQAHGVDVPMVETETGGFWSRRVKGREVEGGVVEKSGGGGSRRLGGNRMGQRTQGSQMMGAEEGIIYDDPWEALRAEFRNKLKMAQDNYVARLIEPLANKDAKPGFGYRPLKVNHPALERIQPVGQTESGAMMLGTQRAAFPNEVADALDDILNPTSILNTALGRRVGAVNSVLTPLRASADASYLFNQGMGELVLAPHRTPQAIPDAVRSIRSAMGEPEVYYRMLDERAARGNELLREAGIDQDAVEWFVQRGAHYQAAGGPGDFQFPQKFEEGLRRLPGGKTPAAMIKWSNETFARYLNLKRVDLNNDALERAVKQGLRGAELDDAMESAIRSNNRATGWTGSQMTGVEALAEFAPRFLRSNVEQIVAAVSKGGMEGHIARQHLLRLLGGAAVITYAANSVRGYNTDIDPRSHNFLRIRNVGGHDVSLLGPFSTLIRASAQTVGGQSDQQGVNQRGRGVVLGKNKPSPDLAAALVGENFSGGFARAKMSPVFSTAWSILSGTTFDQKPFTRDPRKADFYTETIPGLAVESLPFGAQAMIEEGPLAAVTSAVGLQGTPMTPVERREFARNEVANEKFGMDYEKLPLASQRAEVNQDERVAKHDREAVRRRLERTGDDARRADADQQFRAKMEANARFLAEGKDEAGNPFSGNDYRKAYHDANVFRRGQLSQLEEGRGDAELEGYFALYDEATMPNGMPDYDRVEELQAEYLARHPGVQAKLDALIGARDDPTMVRFRQAQKEAREFYQIPAYLGMSLEESRTASQALKMADAYSSTGEAPNRKAAMVLLIERGLLDEEDAMLGLMASRVGGNPERKQFRAEHEAFRQFYSDAVGIEGEGQMFAVGMAAPRRSGGGARWGGGRARSGGDRASSRRRRPGRR